jgi:hypothetical protein
MKGSEMPPAMIRARSRQRRSRRGSCNTRCAGLNQRALLQSVLTRCDHVLAGRQTLCDDRSSIAFVTDHDIARFNLVLAADDEGIESVRSALDGAVGYDRDLLQRVDQQVRRARQAGPQGVVAIVEARLHLKGSNCLIDRVVDEGELALRNRLRSVRTQRNDRHDARGERVVDLRDVFLRRREND